MIKSDNEPDDRVMGSDGKMGEMEFRRSIEQRLQGQPEPQNKRKKIQSCLTYNMYCFTLYTVSILGRYEGYTVKYIPLPEGVPEGEAPGSSLRQRGIFDCVSRFES